MTTFTARRATHQNVTPAEFTGELPTAAVLAGFPARKDGGSTAHASQDQLGYRDMCFGWAGCIDAPELIAAGGCRAIYIETAIGGMGHEGIAAKVYHRD